jgi:hypothetical protein
MGVVTYGVSAGSLPSKLRGWRPPVGLPSRNPLRLLRPRPMPYMVRLCPLPTCISIPELGAETATAAKLHRPLRCKLHCTEQVGGLEAASPQRAQDGDAETELDALPVEERPVCRSQSACMRGSCRSRVAGSATCAARPAHERVVATASIMAQRRDAYVGLGSHGQPAERR